MKKFILFTVIIFFILFLFLCGANLLWKGYYLKGVGSTVSFQMSGNKIIILSNYGMENSAEKISYIDNEIIGNNIYIKLYAKLYNFALPIWKARDIINLPNKGTYKVYYKNPDGTDVFLKEVRYE